MAESYFRADGCGGALRNACGRGAMYRGAGDWLLGGFFLVPGMDWVMGR